MSRRFLLQVGPASVALDGPGDPARWPLDAAHHRFLSSEIPPQLEVRIEHEPSPPPSGRPAFRAGDIVSLYRDGPAWSLRLGGDEPAWPADRVLTLEASGARGTLRLDVGRSPALLRTYPLQYPLEEFLFRHLLAERGALLVHACGVAWEGCGYLFVGSSGAGKSTTARLWRAAGATVLNDDRVVLEATPEGARIHPTPWFGECPDVGGTATPLAALYFLRKGPEVAFEPLRPARAAALVFAKSFPPVWDPDRMGANLEALDRICRQVPCGWLSVPPDARAVDWVRARP